MKNIIIFISFFLLISCGHTPIRNGHLNIRGISMYYEDYGQGGPIVLIHGGGSSMHVSFGKAFKALSKQYRVLAFDEQGHGRTPNSDRPFSFESTADDIVEALKQLNIDSASFIGFSNGATTALHLAIRNPQVVKKLVLGSVLYRKNGASPQFWKFMQNASLKDMPQELKDSYLQIAPNPQDLNKMHDKDLARMLNFKDIPVKDLKKIKAPVLIMQTDRDVPTIEHAVELMNILPDSRLAILPGQHDNFLGNISSVTPDGPMTKVSLSIIQEFLK